MARIKLWLAIALSVVLGVVILQNTEVTTIKVFVWEWTASRIIVLGGTAILGFVVGFVVARLTGRRSGRR